MSKVKDEVGNRYGRLVVIERAGSDKWGSVLWRCKCNCGNVVVARGNHLRSGDTRSCGCLCRERTAERNLKHGLSWHPLYNTWRKMKQRCYNPNASKFKHYGGRGIAVCAAWINDAEAFIIWALGNGWKPGYQIHRIDNDGDYSSDNCIFLSAGEHAKLHRGTK